MKKGLYIGFNGKKEAYIYIWFSKKNGLVYVGETNNICGVLGRAIQHIQPETGTLYNRLYEKGYDLYDIDDFILLSYPLPHEKRFLSEETSYRISVEYLVQKILIERRKDVAEPYEFLSNITPGPFTDLAKMKHIAEGIVDDFLSIYEEV